MAIKPLKYKLFWQICFVTSKIIAHGINLLYLYNVIEMKEEKACPSKVKVKSFFLLCNVYIFETRVFRLYICGNR